MSQRSLLISSFGSETVNNIKAQLNIHNVRFRGVVSEKQTVVTKKDMIIFGY